MNGNQWAMAWLVIQTLLLASAVAGVPFGFFYGLLAGLCSVYNIAVLIRLWVKK